MPGHACLHLQTTRDRYDISSRNPNCLLGNRQFIHTPSQEAEAKYFAFYSITVLYQCLVNLY